MMFVNRGDEFIHEHVIFNDVSALSRVLDEDFTSDTNHVRHPLNANMSPETNKKTNNHEGGKNKNQRPNDINFPFHLIKLLLSMMQISYVKTIDKQCHNIRISFTSE